MCNLDTNGPGQSLFYPTDLLTMGLIEKISLPDERAEYYRLKNNIWSVNLNQKIQDIKKLRAIIEEIPSSILEDSKHLKEMASYCIFLEAELEILTKRYMNFQMEKNQMETMNSGAYIEQ